MTFAFTHALVRTPSPSLSDALGQAVDCTIDYALALDQHARYIAALRALDLEIVALPMLDEHPDACFVEDTAVVFGDAALSTRPGAVSRRGEAHTVAWSLANLGISISRMLPPATLDGGDVLRVGHTFFVGRSARSNRQGIDMLVAFATSVDRMAHVVPVDLPPGLLHLKCHAAALAEDAVLAVEGLALDLPRGTRRIDIPRSEAFAANVVANGTHAIVAAHHPATAAALTKAGFTVHALDTSEFAKAAGSLTCLSVLC